MVKNSPKYLIQIHKVDYVTMGKKEKLSTMLFEKWAHYQLSRVIVRNKTVEAL